MKKPVQPPKWALWFLQGFCHPDFLEEIEGDLFELYHRRMHEYGKLIAWIRFHWDVIRSLRWNALKNFTFFIRIAMWQNFFKMAFRNIKRQKAFTAINVTGLAIGISTCILMLLWIQDEVSYDRFHEKADRIHRVYCNMEWGDGEIATWGNVPQPLVPILESDYPEIEKTVLISAGRGGTFKVEDDWYKETGMYAGKDMFEVFSFELLEGERTTVLEDPYSVVISRNLARKFFGDAWRGNTLGKTIEVDHREVKVTGVFEDVPDNSTLQFDFVLSVEEMISRQEWQKYWGNFNFWLYVLLKENTDPAIANNNIQDIVADNHPDSGAELFLHSMKKEYLYSHFENGRSVGGRIMYVRIFSVVALFLLVIVCINFMNLATARSFKRAKEIGIRKVIGATRNTLIGQFMSESMIIVFMSMILVVILVELALPQFNILTGKEIYIDYFSWEYWTLFFGLAIITGLLSGSYPSFFLSSFKIVNVLKGTLKFGGTAVSVRKGLVVFQFTLSILMIVGAMVVHQQVDYIRTKNLGINKEHVIYSYLTGNIIKDLDAYREKLLSHEEIEAVTVAGENPLQVGNSTSDPSWEGKDPDLELFFHVMKSDHNFASAMRVPIIEGRDFSNDYSLDSANLLVNEATVRAMGVEDPIGMEVSFWGQTGRIVGVMKDFHIASLHTPIEPLIITNWPSDAWILYARTKPGMTKGALNALEKEFHAYHKDLPFDYNFLDETYEKTYRSETIMGKLTNYFAIIAIFIACLGLLGLASFTAQQRTREIGIRKVLGASVVNLVGLISGEFTKLVGIAFLIAAPVAWYAMSQWLQEFAYHIDIGPGTFILAGIASIAIAWLTIGFLAIKAARANPIEAIKVE